jgi:glyoxylase-like metal-dependent hydrolase (beta-lactamase superfamily II)
MELERDAAPGIHRIEDAHTNWYLVEDGDRLTVVDCGVPTSWRSLHEALRTLGKSPDAIAAVVLTHAHFDHVGFAERARTELGVEVWCHENDVPLAKHPQQYAHERSRLAVMAANPQALPVVLGFVRTRAFFPKPVRELRRYDGGTLAVPGSPRVVFTPGHTLGHCSLHFADRDALIAGDAVVTFNPYLAKPGPQVVSGAATADYERAFASLAAVAATGAKAVLCGHGPVWREGAEAIAERARAAGRS